MHCNVPFFRNLETTKNTYQTMCPDHHKRCQGIEKRHPGYVLEVPHTCISDIWINLFYHGSIVYRTLSQNTIFTLYNDTIRYVCGAKQWNTDSQVTVVAWRQFFCYPHRNKFICQS